MQDFRKERGSTQGGWTTDIYILIHYLFDFGPGIILIPPYHINATYIYIYLQLG